MALLSTDVNLPIDHKPRFPDRCVVCGAPSPNSTVRLTAGIVGWWTPLWHFGPHFAVEAPACKSCGWRLHWQLFLDFLILIGLCGGAVWLACPLLEHRLPRASEKWIIMGIGLLAAAPFLLWRLFHPYPFDITAYAKSVDYEFRDEEAAREFAELNQDAEWVKIG